ncbi:hypothetical protein I552_8407 [Mycobacterium xenopi 3993]|nr:hypothetical protein I552_8407 [Mycobacterium xenopi 3993]
MKHGGGHRNSVVLAAGEQRGIFRQLAGVDLTGSDATQNVVGASKLLALAVLSAGKFHPAHTPYSSRCSTAYRAQTRCCASGHRRKHSSRASVEDCS